MGQNRRSWTLTVLHSYHKIGLTWAEVHTAAQEEEMAKSQVPTWEDIMNMKPTGEEKNLDMEDNQSAAGPQFEDVIIEEVIKSVTEEESEPPVTGELLTQLSEAAGGTVGQKDMPTYAGEVQL